MAIASTRRYGSSNESDPAIPAADPVDPENPDDSLIAVPDVSKELPNKQAAWKAHALTSLSLEEDVGDDEEGPTDYLFPWIIVTQIFMYLEAGAVPSLLEQFTRTFHMNPEEQGLLGAIVYISISAASPWCSTLFKRYCPRTVLGVTLALNNFALLCFALAPTVRWFSKSLLVFLRAIVGATQAFHCVYSVLWVHEYAPRSKKGQWMSFLQAAVPLGITLGYLAGSVALWAAPNADNATTHAPLLILPNSTDITAVKSAVLMPALETISANILHDVGTKDTSICAGIFCWRWPFLFQFVIILPLSILLFNIPREHIAIRFNSKPVVVDESTSSSEDETKGVAETYEVVTLNPKPTAADERTRLTSPGTPELTPTSQRRHRIEEAERGWDNLLALLSQRVYVCVVLGLSGLFFVVTGVQFWGTMYFSTNTTDSVYKIHIAYLLVSGTGPILGVFFGGWLIDNFGGYAGTQQQAKALKICSVMALLACIASLPVTFVHTTWSIACSLWLMLFLGGSILPACSGIVISSAPRRLRPLASSVAYTSYNMLGYAASNYVPGLIMNWIVRSVGDSNQWCDIACTYRTGFRIVLFWGFCSVCCLFTASVSAEAKAKEALERSEKRRQDVLSNV